MHFDDFIKAACENRHLDWRKYRRASRRKVMDRIFSLGLKGFEPYLNYLASHPEEAEELPNLLRVTVTRFFREQECWEKLAKHILPRLVDETSGNVVRAMSIGACGGEEPYSLALMWKETVQALRPGKTVCITALEIDDACLERARAGVYQKKTLREVKAQTRRKWFEQEGTGLRLHPEIRDMVCFRRVDALKDPLPEHQDLVLCRYLFFTYFTDERLMESCRKIHQSMTPGGVLMTGRKESPGPCLAHFFRPISKGGCFFDR